MPENKPGGLKLKLRKADTNRLKTETGRLKTEQPAPDPSEAPTLAVPVPPAPTAAPVPPPPEPVAPNPEQTAEIRDPMALRDTSQGKLRRIQSPDETANAISPAPVGEQGVKRETVRLKVVRETKKAGPQILPPAAPAADAAPPPSPDAAAPPSAQTVKISLPGLRKPAKAGSDESVKRATSTVRVQEPAETAGGTLKVSPPGGEYRETSTATLKVGLRKPGEAAPAAEETAAPGDAVPVSPPSSGTLKIKPGPRLGLKKGQQEQSKQVTAALKVVHGDTAGEGEQAAQDEGAEEAPLAEASTNKQITATLKVRSGDVAQKDTANTVKITMPAAPAAPEDEASAGGKPSLRLKKPGKAAASETVRVPLPVEAGEEDAGRTVALSGEPGEESGDASGTIRLEPAAQEAERPEGEQAPEAALAEEAKPAIRPRPVSEGPGALAFVFRFAACGALGALVYRLVMDFLSL